MGDALYGFYEGDYHLLLKTKFYSEDEVKELFARLEKLDMSLQFKQRMMTISQGDILLIPKQELEKIKSEFLGDEE